MTAPRLSKSRYLAGCQCERRLWLTSRAPELASPPDAAKQASFELGREIGRRAHALFPGGVLVAEDAAEHGRAVERTRALLAQPDVPAVFEAAFEHAGVRIRVDVLEKLPRGLGLREVKSAARVRPQHVEDCAVQLVVLEACGLDVPSVELLHVNTAYVRAAGEIDWGAFFARADLTREATAARASVRERLSRFHEVLHEPLEPGIEPARHCHVPYACEFWAHCTRAKPADWTFHLPRIGDGYEALREAGIERITEIPDAHPLSAPQRRIRAALRSGGPSVEPGLAARLRTSGPPAHYLDFETMNPAFPPYPGTRPYQALPFQWSLHTDAGDGDLRHREFLAGEGADPRRAFAETLVAALTADDAPVLVYSRYEGIQLRQLADLFPDLAPALLALHDRLLDLLPAVRRHVYHPAFDFSFSLKAVAPALAPDFGWHDLETIADGAAASRAFAALATGRVAAAERDGLRAELRAYCARDTLALARIHRALRELAR
jgi:hypothetical protein